MDIQGYRQVATSLYLDWFGCGEWWPVQGGMARVAHLQELGGLGVLDLTMLEYALRMRWS
jgi:hypothetical protein